MEMQVEFCGFEALLIAKMLTSTFLAIVFVQSGLDKVINWSGNLEWLKGHFAKTPLKNMVPLLLGTLTLLEIAAGALCAGGMIVALMGGSITYMFWGGVMSAISVIALFFGQRMAQDYDGAANLVAYFILTIISLVLFAIPV